MESDRVIVVNKLKVEEVSYNEQGYPSFKLSLVKQKKHQFRFFGERTYTKWSGEKDSRYVIKKEVVSRKEFNNRSEMGKVYLFSDHQTAQHMVAVAVTDNATYLSEK